MNFTQRYQPSLSWIDEFDRFFDRSRFNPASQAGPRESVHESEDAWILRLDLPGFAREDVKLTVTGRSLELTAETPDERPFGGKLERQWKLGEDVNAGTISALLQNGVLELKLPKRPKEETEPKTIAIR